MHFNSRFWLKFSLFNLFLVSILGLLMRYKIGFEFPYLQQKHLQESHSHFAFVGWISHTIMVLMVAYLSKRVSSFSAKKYNVFLTANLFCAYAMLFSFIIEGYGIVSIVFSSLTILISFAFGYFFYIDSEAINNVNVSKKWFNAALFFNIISSFGTLALAHMMATKNIHQNEYLASIYYYLHFQYNGWFFFACMGFLYDFFNLKATDSKVYNSTFRLFFVACIPAYFLSILWLKLPTWLYIFPLVSAVLQVFAWYKFLLILKSKKEFLKQYPFFLRYILLFVAFALSIKLILQLGSTIPYVSQLAFGFRPIVIAYLHLVLLAIITLFLLFYIYANSYINHNHYIKKGIILFSIGVLLNEVILAAQGIGSFSYTVIPYANELLFGVSLLMVIGIAITVFYSLKKVKIS